MPRRGPALPLLKGPGLLTLSDHPRGCLTLRLVSRGTGGGRLLSWPRTTDTPHAKAPHFRELNVRTIRRARPDMNDKTELTIACRHQRHAGQMRTYTGAQLPLPAKPVIFGRSSRSRHGPGQVPEAMQAARGGSQNHQKKVTTSRATTPIGQSLLIVVPARPAPSRPRSMMLPRAGHRGDPW